MHKECHGDLLAMADRPVVFGAIPLARGALQLAPGAAMGMAIGAQIAPPQPAAIATAPMGAEVLRGLHGARPAVRRGPRLRWRRRWLGGLGGFALTPGARRSLGQASKRFRFLRALASGGRGWHDRLVRGSGVIGPEPAEHQEDAPQRHETEVVKQEGWYHGNAPA